MTNKETILKTIDFIEDKLKHEISVMDIAQEGCYSLYHFIRLFTSITGLSPNKYLLQRRLTESIKELRKTNKKVAEIAYEFQFSTPEGYTRAFKNYFGVSPSKLRTNDEAISMLVLTHRITAETIYRSSLVKNQEPDLLELEERLLVGISFFMDENEPVNDLSSQWGQLMSHAHKIKNKTQEERYYQVQFWSEDQDIGGMYFFIGVEVLQISNIDPQFVLKVIPKGRYLRFIHKGLANKVGYTYHYIYNQYLPDTNFKLGLPFNFEYFGPKCLGPHIEDSESEIYIPIL